MRNSPLSNIIAGPYSQSMAIIGWAIAAVGAYLLLQAEPPEMLFPLICDVEKWFAIDRLWVYVLHFAEISMAALLLSYMAYSRVLIRARSKLPGIFLLLFCCSYPAFFLEPLNGSFITIIFAVIYLILFSPSTEFRSSLHTYVISFFLSAAGIVYPSMFLYIPLFWLGSAKITPFGFKCFFASLLGIVTPFWLLGAAQVVWDFSFCFQNFVSNFYPLHIIDYRQVSPQVVYMAMIAVIGIFCCIRNMVLQYEDKIITRINNSVVNIVFFYTLILICINNNGLPVYLAVLNVCVSLQAAHYFTHAGSKRAVFLFYLIITVFILFFLWSLLQDLVSGVI